ncbi:MAG: flagellar basal body P-ring formation chaperone FlgA [Gammaproteobacteria bacterium]
MKVLTLLSVLLFSGQLYAAATTQSLEEMQSSVHSFVEASLLPDGQYQISSAQIDDRLQLPACDEGLEIFAQSGEIKPGRNTVGIHCASGNNWTIYSTVQVKSFKEVLILRKQLNRNDRISPDHITTEVRDVALLQQGFVADPQDIINKQATRSLAVGTVLNRTHYAEPTLIKRGDQISIESGRNGFLITSKGVALMNGAKGEQINVKNISSRRVIQATVKQPGVVTVYF